MKAVQKESIMKTMDQMLSTLDLLEMNISLRVNHTLKDKRECVNDKVEITEMHIQHMESKIMHHEEKGSWLQTFQNIAVSISG